MRKIILIIMDGWGCAPAGPGNFISMAEKPNFDCYFKNYPYAENDASGEAVGLPPGTQGNSEVGHLHLGAGRIVLQKYGRINKSIESGDFIKNKELTKAFDLAKRRKARVHLVGLCSDEAIHAHTDHLLALLDMAKKRGAKNVFVHFIADGRDVPEHSAHRYVGMIEERMGELKVGKIASVVGRYYAMDRDKNWDRTKEAYGLMALGVGHKAKSANEAIDNAYQRGDKTDYYIQPTVIVGKNDKPIGLVKEGDCVIFFNFRSDRPRQLTEAFISKDFKGFDRQAWPKTKFVTFTQYDSTFDCPFAFGEEDIPNNLGSILSSSKVRQLRIAETEKYPHVTFFFNSQVEKPYPGEERIVVPSPKVPSYDKKPEMSASEVTETLLEEIESGEFGFILVNYANCDLVGHSAVKSAIIKATEVVDDCVGKVVDAGLDNGYTVLVTADHGNAEDKLYPDGKLKPSHSLNKVPFLLISPEKELRNIRLRCGGLIDVAPTILDIMGINKPTEMTGESLISNRN
ncbi:MAG: 2,3-bisphosphoglycerate-independent phosphoglycerate mutase [Candidatus Aenigmarchaeota archaeon]|nr:2,3-bisphosphoglycerate-independent phosphoglycerate mutase [Candidatus Aenigmarchaeota archaeon]